VCLPGAGRGGPGPPECVEVVTARAKAIAWRHSQDALQCEAIEPWAHGTVLRTPSAPNFWDANFVRVEGDASDLEPQALVRAGDELLAGSRHRKLEVEDEAAGARMRPFFDAAGWVADRNAAMLREGPAVAHADVEEVTLLDTRPLRVEWYLSYENDAAAQEALADAQDRISIRRGMRAFVVRGAGGAPVGFTTLAVGADGVEIDQLYVTPGARSSGIGGRLVESALAAGGHSTAWVVADDEGLARALYERLGFETVWRQHAFVRHP
jgi:ribosomal protein S18 acetylase RimI-like enzyme